MKEMARVKSQKNIKIDKALAAFKVNTFGVSDLPALLLVNLRVDTCCMLYINSQALDTDNSGYLDREEFLNFASNMPSKNREKLLRSLDTDGDGRIDLDEFRKLFNK